MTCYITTREINTKTIRLKGISSVVERVPWEHEAGSSILPSPMYCGVAKLVQRPAVNGKIIGSIPITAATIKHTEAIRIGKEPVLKTGAAKAMQVRVHAASAICSRIAKLVRHNALNVANPGSSPGPGKLCPSSSSLRHSVVGRVTRARISLGTPLAGVTQPVEVTVSKTVRSEFESQHQQIARLGKLVNPPALEAGFSEFESQAGHHSYACRLMANHPAPTRQLGVRLAPRVPTRFRRLAAKTLRCRRRYRRFESCRNRQFGVKPNWLGSALLRRRPQGLGVRIPLTPFAKMAVMVQALV
jgi:hypothetical protein